MTHLATEAVGEAGAPDRRPGEPAEGANHPSPSRGEGWLSRRWVLILAEVVVSVMAALGYTLLSRHIGVNPMNRIGQVSGLSRLQLYVAVLGLPLLGLLLYTAYRGSDRRHRIVKRLVCGALAGLATGVVAGGIVVALRGTRTRSAARRATRASWWRWPTRSCRARACRASTRPRSRR